MILELLFFGLQNEEKFHNLTFALTMSVPLDVLPFAKHFHTFPLSSLEIVLGQFDTL